MVSYLTMENSVNTNLDVGLESYIVSKNNIDRNNIPDDAIYLLNKPFEWSSFKLVKRLKFYTKKKRVGHAGTLDPLATGLMIICTGKCTKMIEQIQNLSKTYTGVFNFGKTTPSFDLETEFDNTYEYSHIEKQQIQETIKLFKGDVVQTPPQYSAIKVNGTRAYKKARIGEYIEIKSRTIHIYEFEVDGELPDLNFEVKCSKGTYIRTLANDFAKKLESGCYLTELKRTEIGFFNIENAFEIEELKEILGYE